VPQAVSRKEIQPLTSEQALALFEAARGDRLEALYVLAVATGLRQGELLALKWEDVELEEAVLRVRRTLTRSGGKVEVEDHPKRPTAAAAWASPPALSRLCARIWPVSSRRWRRWAPSTVPAA
jgi:integrase